MYIIDCRYCGKVCKSAGGLTNHSRFCKPRRDSIERMCEAARKQWRKNKRSKIAKEEELKSKQVRVKEENNKQAKEDSVSAYSLVSCL